MLPWRAEEANFSSSWRVIDGAFSRNQDSYGYNAVIAVLPLNLAGSQADVFNWACYASKA